MKDKLDTGVLTKNFFKITGFALVLIAPYFLPAQNKVDLSQLTSFKDPAANWHIAGDVRADLNKNELLVLFPGNGILVNQSEPGKHGQDLLFNTFHGDLDLELDYMMAKGSNSGIYLQGRYEVQLFDSWGKITPTSADNGGVYERWNDSKPDGQKGYEGHAPRQNAGRAPGLWQHLKISFQAPRFDATGKKIENAKMMRIELNGIAIQENVELSGPTRGALGNDEVTEGPLRIQGDHGPVAFRNIVINKYDKPRPELVDLKYEVYKGKYEAEPDYKKLPPEAKGTSFLLSSNVSNIPNEFLIRYTGTLRVKEPGEYNFNLNTAGGRGYLKIKDQPVIRLVEWGGKGKITLAAGDAPFELLYSKYYDWAKPALGLSVAGPGVREYLISDVNVAPGDQVDPILINAPVNTIMRSFVDIDTIRVTHAVNVGSAQQLHYTYDLDKGMIVQVWRGGFLDATPMWHSRGDGSSRAVGSVQRFGKPLPALETLSSPGASWSADTTGTGYRPKGYVLDDSDKPAFRYQVYNTLVKDASRVLPGNQGLQREITVQDLVPDLYMRLAEGSVIESISEGLYLVDDKSYYIRIDDAGGAMPVIRDADGRKELIIPVKNKLNYSILF
ncbi:MAG: DUF1080 domain-containing protein [Ferruginibacter sp.]